MKRARRRLVLGVLVLAACHERAEPTGPAPSPVASVSLTPPAATAVVGGTVQLTATLKDAAGSELTGRTVTWASSDSAVATVSETGLVTAVALGSATITAASGGQRATAEITVAVISFAVLSAGHQRACGITTSGAAYCWGDNGAGALGNGSTVGTSAPVAVMGGLSFVDVSVAGGDFGSHTCAITTGAAAYCWGFNGNGELGNGSTISSPTPVPVAGGLSLLTVSASDDHNCAVTTSGAAYCWGSNFHGELGNGTTTASSTPVAVVGDLTFATVSVVAAHTRAAPRRRVRRIAGDRVTLGSSATESFRRS